MARAKKADAVRTRKAEAARVILSLGDDVSTDVIYPGRFMATVLPTETPAHAFADHAAFQAAVKAKADSARSRHRGRARTSAAGRRASRPRRA